MLTIGTSKHRVQNAEFHKKIEFIQCVTKCYVLKNWPNSWDRLNFYCW